jgi:predicted permease
VLLSGSAVLGRSLLHLRAITPGFDATDVLTFRTDAAPTTWRTARDVSRFYREALDTLARLPGVATAAVTSKLPLSGWNGEVPIFVEDSPRPEGALPALFVPTAVSSDYLIAMRIPLIAGRTLDDVAARRGDREAVVSRSFAQFYWHDSTGQRAIGRRIRPAQYTDWYTIVGVASDVRDSSLTADPTTTVYLAEDAGADTAIAWPRGTRSMAFVLRTHGAAPALAVAAERAIHALDPATAVYDVATMQQRVNKAGSRTTFVLLLLAAGAATTLALGIVGLYGVIAYMVGLRSREIGIRIALGLSPGRAARLIFLEGEAIVFAGAILGAIAFIVFARLLASLVYQVSIVDATALACSALTVLVIASAATWIPARRASLLDPAHVLKLE